MAEGFVKWFNSEKGCGSLTVMAGSNTDRDTRVGNQEVFVHYSEIQMTGYRTLDEGEYVSFAVERDAKGNPIARHVTPLGPPSQFLLDFYAAKEKAERDQADSPSSRAGLAVLLIVFLAILIVAIGIGLL